ncbi:MAG: hypothetical protein K8S56_01745 [Candidatus Cloacimonetes bacterium]|nr:hypothetical protein [Candidatus Cloacimonadota bacterium]
MRKHQEAKEKYNIVLLCTTNLMGGNYDGTQENKRNTNQKTNQTNKGGEMKISILTIILLLCISNMVAEYTITEPYEFPIEYKSKRWGELRRARKLIEVYQIPQDIMSEMTTIAILETLLGCPYVDDCLGYENLEGCFSSMMSRLNMFDELTKREDFKETLIKEYLSKCKEPKPLKDSVDKFGIRHTYRSFIKIFGSELLLAQPIIQEQLLENEKLELYDIINDRFNAQPSLDNSYSVNTRGTFILGHHLLSNNDDYIDKYRSFHLPEFWIRSEVGRNTIQKHIFEALRGKK